MAASSTYFKLGLFTLLAIAAAAVVAFALGVRAVRAETVEYHTYFDESVQGLEIGSPVKYRGVPIGSVAAIEIAPDRRLVDVTLALDEREWQKLGLSELSPALRTQLGTQGLTGVKFVDIDFFDPRTYPPPELDFTPPANYIPSAPSLIKGLEENLELVVQHLPALIDATTKTVSQVESILKDFRGERIANRMSKAIGNIDGAAADMRVLLRRIDRAQIPEKMAAGVERLAEAIDHADAMIERVGGDRGLVASTQRATDSIGDLGRSTAGTAEELERTLREMSGAAQAIRDLAESIDRDPDMLVKGRAKGRRER